LTKTRTGCRRGSLAFPCRRLHLPTVRWTQLPPRRTRRVHRRLPRRHTALRAAPESSPPKWLDPEAPLLRFFKEHPSIDKNRVCSLLVAQGLDLPPSKHVPPLPFLPASTVYTTRGLAGLLRPAADHGVHLVSSRSSTKAEDQPSSQMRTLQSFSLPDAGGFSPCRSTFTKSSAPLDVDRSKLWPDLRG
jgi:hypothetical protein